MRFHLPALPGQPVTTDNAQCAFTQKVRKFKPMMEALGHEVTIYEGSDSTPPPFTPEAWEPFNSEIAPQIIDNAEPGDVLGLMGGLCQKDLAASLPGLFPVEYGIGYGGSFAPYRVFETYAWMHTTYGAERGTNGAVGGFFDAVIPAYFEAEEYPAGDGGDYLLFVGRMTEDKGPHIAAEAAKRLDMPLILAGSGDFIPDYGEYVGPVGPEKRNELMAGARALFVPTTYIEPFGCVAVEAMLCGTPAITTDWGAFTETVEQGVTGYRCHTLGEFCDAVELTGDLDREHIRDHAIANYSLEAVGLKYERYFNQLQTLKGEGWYSDWSGLAVAA